MKKIIIMMFFYTVGLQASSDDSSLARRNTQPHILVYENIRVARLVSPSSSTGSLQELVLDNDNVLEKERVSSTSELPNNAQSLNNSYHSDDAPLTDLFGTSVKNIPVAKSLSSTKCSCQKNEDNFSGVPLSEFGGIPLLNILAAVAVHCVIQ